MLIVYSLTTWFFWKDKSDFIISLTSHQAFDHVYMYYWVVWSHRIKCKPGSLQRTAKFWVWTCLFQHTEWSEEKVKVKTGGKKNQQINVQKIKTNSVQHIAFSVAHRCLLHWEATHDINHHHHRPSSSPQHSNRKQGFWKQTRYIEK